MRFKLHNNPKPYILSAQCDKYCKKDKTFVNNECNVCPLCGLELETPRYFKRLWYQFKLDLTRLWN